MRSKTKSLILVVTFLSLVSGVGIIQTSEAQAGCTMRWRGFKSYLQCTGDIAKVAGQITSNLQKNPVATVLAAPIVVPVAIAQPIVTPIGHAINTAYLEAQAQTLAPYLQNWIIESRNSALSSGTNAIPQKIKDQLRGYYPDALLDKVRYRVGTGNFFALASWTQMRVNGLGDFGGRDAMTLDYVIVFKSPYCRLPTGSGLAAVTTMGAWYEPENDDALWAHELRHVLQYERWGLRDFAIHYLRSFNSVEDEATTAENQYIGLVRSKGETPYRFKPSACKDGVVLDKANKTTSTPPFTIITRPIGTFPTGSLAVSGQFSTPLNGTQVQGIVPLEVKAMAPAGIANVQMAINGNTTFCKIEKKAPYTCNWDSRKVPNGSHVLTAVVRDKANNTMSPSPVTVTVQNQRKGSFPPPRMVPMPAIKPRGIDGVAEEPGVDLVALNAAWNEAAISQPEQTPEITTRGTGEEASEVVSRGVENMKGSLPGLSVSLERQLFFITRTGQSLTLPPGTYVVGLAGPEQLRLSTPDFRLYAEVYTVAGDHQEDISRPVVMMVSDDDEPDIQQLVMILPGGKLLGAAGSLTGKRPKEERPAGR
jgi:hypothetical protein